MSDLVKSFIDITGSDASQAQFFLESHNFNLEDAINSFLENGAGDTGISHARPESGARKGPQVQDWHDDDDDDVDDIPDPRRASPPPSPYRFENTDTPSGALHRPGGGMQVSELHSLVGKGTKPVPTDHVTNIFDKAKELGAMSVDEANATRPKNFTGSGQTLGKAGDLSSTHAVIGDSTPIIRTLTFWSDGFSVDDGPLREFNDSANASLLRQIHSGVAPRELMDPTQPWREVEINLVDKKTEKFTPPPKKFHAFEGGGQTLSSGHRSVSVSAPSENLSARGLVIDECAPITNVSIRIANGTRMIARFNHTHTVADLYAFVRSAQSTRQQFELVTTFPHNVLTNMQVTLQDAHLLNANVVQKLL
eukprot:c9554_g1_i1.p1 GENE.c9554_g1_i1~~c9554_g1_i1.p1  ORF type:complete len:373 (+),score=81.48 c9554_g1_i1:27-1121(+)